MGSRKIVLNRCYGGFTLSEKAIEMLVAATECDPDDAKYTPQRDNPELVKIVETLGEEASGRNSKLVVVEIPDDVEWQLDTYDGMERIAEVHRIWY